MALSLMSEEITAGGLKWVKKAGIGWKRNGWSPLYRGNFKAGSYRF